MLGASGGKWRHQAGSRGCSQSMIENQPGDPPAPTQLQRTLEEYSTVVTAIQGLGVARHSDHQYDELATRLLELEEELRRDARDVSPATRERLRREYRDELGYIGDLL